MLETIIRESPAAMALWVGPELVFELVNPAYQAIFGTRQLVGLPLVAAVPELASQEFPSLLRRVYETGEPYHGREMVAKIAVESGALEDHYYDFTYVRVLDADGKPYGVYNHATDVTERVLARRAMEASVQELQEERDLRVRFVAALAHDLRTPIGAARLGAELIAQRSTDANIARTVERIVSNLDRAEAMIRDLLDLRRIRSGEPIPLERERCDLAALVRTTVAELVAAHGDRFVVEAPGELRGTCDPRAVRRILENLAGNAVKYGAPKTPVTITLVRATGAVALRVHNQGPPIPVEQQAEMFRLFKRHVSSRDGWGIGLSLVEALAQAHGGTVAVDSGPGRGTTFTVQLPLEPG